MKLKKYLEEKQLTQEQFATLIGVTQSAVCQWLSEKTSITVERALDIEKKTKGAVRCRDLLPGEVFSKRKAA